MVTNEFKFNIGDRVKYNNGWELALEEGTITNRRHMKNDPYKGTTNQYIVNEKIYQEENLEKVTLRTE